MKSSYFYFVIFLQTLLFSTVRAQVEPCLTNPIFSDTCCPVLMNEILPEGYGGESWVELYNCNSDTVSLLGWCLTNDPLYPCKFPLSCVVPPQAFFVVQLPFTISRSFGSLQLWENDTTMAYGMTFDDVHIGESVGYCGTMITRQEPSPGELNTCFPFTDIRDVPVEKEGEFLFYNFLGQRVEVPSNGLYIFVRQNGKDICVRKCIRFP